MRLLIIALLIVVPNPCSAILVDATDDQASLALAASYPFMGCGAGWDIEGGTRYRAGSCNLIRNNSTEGAWIVTAKHAIHRDSTGEAIRFLRYCFELSYFDGFPKDTTSFIEEKTVLAVHDKVYYHATQDVALVKLHHLIYDTTGNLVVPVKFYTGTLSQNQAVLIGGFGETGIPSQGGSQGTGYRDGFGRCARGVFRFFFESEATIDFRRTVPVPGMASAGDSGGLAAIEKDGNVLIAGVIATVSGSGEGALTSFEYFNYDPDFNTWINTIISENAEHVSSVAEWKMYQ